MGKGSSALLTPLERFLSGSFEKKLYDPNRVIPHIGTIGIGSSTGFYDGLLIGGAGSYCSVGEGFFVDNGKEGSNRAKSTSCNSSSAPVVSATNVVKGQWTAEEDGLLVKLVKQHGVRKWSQIAKKLVGRIGKQCRERWHNHLRPDIKKDTWSEEEERLLVEAHEKVGNRWAEIAKRIPGRSENSIKNHWNTTKRRQNSKKKSKRKSGQGPRSHPSILQEYIRSKTLVENSFAHSEPLDSVSAYDSSFSASSYTNNCMKTMQEGYDQGDLIGKPSILDGSFDFLRFGNNDGQLMGLEGSFLASSRAIEPWKAPENPNYDGDQLHLSYLLEGGPSSSFNACNINWKDMGDQHSSSFKKDMDLIEMISSSQSSCSQRRTVAGDSLDCLYF